MSTVGQEVVPVSAVRRQHLQSEVGLAQSQPIKRRVKSILDKTGLVYPGLSSAGPTACRGSLWRVYITLRNRVSYVER